MNLSRKSFVVLTMSEFWERLFKTQTTVFEFVNSKNIYQKIRGDSKRAQGLHNVVKPLHFWQGIAVAFAQGLDQAQRDIGLRCDGPPESGTAQLQ
jgi:hypothetical protein